ncbi:MAG TPA: hypothetical protein VKB43_06900 [Gaiellaceae bacterium]|nr:hypothetical protein [Gaiellaceae bacterium]
MRRIALAALAFAGMLVAVPSALASWHTLGTGVENTVIPSMIVTKAGTELVSFESPVAGTISVARAGGAAHTVVTGDPIAGQTQLVQLPDSSIQLYFPNGSGVARMTSTNDGVSWTGPIQTQSHDVGGVVGATVGPDGTPYFVQNGTGFVNVFEGVNGGVVRNVFADCCGYGTSIAVDSTGVVRVAFYSNAQNTGNFIVEQLDSNLVPGQTYGFAPTAPRDDRIPLVSDSSGFTYMGWAPGYPDASSFSVQRFQGSATPKTGMQSKAKFTGGDPHMALSVDPANRLWAAWTGQGRVHVTRSRTHAAHTGAQVSTKLNGTAYDISAVGLPGSVGAIDVIVNTGSSLVEQQLEPGLSVRAFHKVKVTKVGKKKKTLVLHYVQALDDLTPVAGATFQIGGHTYHANSKGTARVPAGQGKAAAAGYVGTSFKTR